MSNEKFAVVFQRLRDILLPYAKQLVTVTDDDHVLYVDTAHTMANGQPLFFGKVSVSRRYVGFHLMPVYVDPSLLDDVSSDLKKRMQGKSCFNFTKVDETLFIELAQLTERGYAMYAERNFVPSR
ncbi:MAG: hypothetical protein AAGC71_05530 [Pseudomonadota bacterium]